MPERAVTQPLGFIADLPDIQLLWIFLEPNTQACLHAVQRHKTEFTGILKLSFREKRDLMRGLQSPFMMTKDSPAGE